MAASLRAVPPAVTFRDVSEVVSRLRELELLINQLQSKAISSELIIQNMGRKSRRVTLFEPTKDVCVNASDQESSAACEDVVC